MYCGNNARSLDLRSGRKVIGTRYSCMRKGVGVGLGLPYDPTYATRYVPIDNRKIYCGNDVALPVGYDLMGSNGMCYTRGVGIGRSIKAKKHREGRVRARFGIHHHGLLEPHSITIVKRKSRKSRRKSRKNKSRRRRSSKRKSRKRSRSRRKSRKRRSRRKSRKRSKGR